MIDQQMDLELKYNVKHVQTMLLDHIDPEHILFNTAIARVEQYRNKEYSYESKNKRIAKINRFTDEIVLEVLVATIPIQEIVPIQGVCTKLGACLGIKDRLESVKTAAEILAVLSGPFYEIYPFNHEDNPTGTMGILSRAKLPEGAIRELEQIQYVPPMLCVPKDWETHTDGGALTTRENAILGAINWHDENIALDVLNILQHTAYELDENILDLDECPAKEFKNEKAEQQFYQLKKESAAIYELFKDKPFHFIYKYDSRGRVYSQGYHINIQSYEYKRSLINLHKKWRVTC